MSLYSNITLPGHPDYLNIQRLDVLAIPTLMEMMRIGFSIDIPYLQDMSTLLTENMEEKKDKICSYIPEDKLEEFVSRSNVDAVMNVDSNEQVEELLFKVLKIGKTSNLKRTKSGKRVSTGKKQLEALKREHPIVQDVLDYREYAKLKSTYTQGLIDNAVLHNKGKCWCGFTHFGESWRIHTTITTTRTETGRLACLPVRAEILTDLGWRTKSQLKLGDFVLGYNFQTERLDWCEIKNIHSGQGQLGTMIWQSNKVSKCNAKCTDNHKWIAVGNYVKIKDFIRSHDLTQKNTKYAQRGLKLILSAPAESGILNLSPHIAALIGWAVTDGHIIKTCTGRRALEITVVKLTSVSALRKLLRHFPHTYSRYNYQSTKNMNLRWRHRFYIGVDTFEPIAAQWMDKYSLSELALHSTISARESMYEAMMEADGSPRHTGKRFGAMKKEVIDGFMCLAVTLGKRVTYSKRDTGFVDINMPTWSKAGSSRYIPSKLDDPIEDIWCPETELGSWIARLDGEVFLTGNSKAPNLQNIPVRTELGRLIRQAFIASEGMVLVGCDWSQIEMRLGAHYSEDDNLLRIFWEGIDPHDDTAKRAFQVSNPDKLTQRDPCKSVNFGVFYGLRPPGLYDLMCVTYATAGIPVPEWLTVQWCDDFIRQWFKLYPGVKEYLKEQHYRAYRYGEVWTLFGRVRRVPEVRSVHKRVVEAGLRQAGNMPIQGTSADMMRMVLAEVQQWIETELRSAGIMIYPLLSVHDEGIWEVQSDYAQEFKQGVEGIFERVLTDRETGECLCRVPIKADGKVMERWEK